MRMSGVLALQNMVEISVFYRWMTTSIFNAIIFSVCDVYLFVKLFRVNSTKSKLIQAILIEAILKIISVILFPVPYYRAVHLVLTIILFKTQTKYKK